MILSFSIRTIIFRFLRDRRNDGYRVEFQSTGNADFVLIFKEDNESNKFYLAFLHGHVKRFSIHFSFVHSSVYQVYLYGNQSRGFGVSDYIGFDNELVRAWSKYESYLKEEYCNE